MFAGLLGIVLLLFELVLIARIVVDWIGVLSPVGVVGGTVLANNVAERTLEVGFACLVLFFAAQLVRRALRDDEATDQIP